MATALTTVQRNKKFDASSMSGQRKQIAQDVIDHVKSRWLQASPGTYLRTYLKDDFRSLASTANIRKKTQLNSLLRERAESCNVCAIGAVFVATVDRHNDLSCSYLQTHDENEASKMLSYLKKWFSESQLRLMEIAFEVEDAADRIDDMTGADFDDATSGEECAAMKFGMKYKSADNRLIAIMKNIIANNGKFIPPKIPFWFDTNNRFDMSLSIHDISEEKKKTTIGDMSFACNSPGSLARLGSSIISHCKRIKAREKKLKKNDEEHFELETKFGEDILHMDAYFFNGKIDTIDVNFKGPDGCGSLDTQTLGETLKAGKKFISIAKAWEKHKAAA